MRLYKLNLESVNKQYDEEEPEDTQDHCAVFEDYKRKALCMTDLELERLVNVHLVNFFRSVDYQIEDEHCSAGAVQLLFDYLTLMQRALHHNDESDCWGKISI